MSLRKTDRPLVTRRDLLATTLAGASLIAARRFLGAQDSARRTASPVVVDGLIIRNQRPLDAETSFADLEPWLTDAERFFVRSHFGPPAQLPADWTLTIDGDVGTPVKLTLDEIRALPDRTRTVTLECAGNGRGVYALPVTSGVQWEYGAVSNARWTGVPVSALLERAGVLESAQHIWSEGLDHAPLDAVPKFLRSIPRDVATSGAFVAYQMNGGPIPLLHGGPLRLIVPGWYGMASAKWLTHLHARPTVSDNFYMARGYHYAEQKPVERIRVKSVISSPTNGERITAGRTVVRGKAWSGSGGIRAVEVSTDGGRQWRPARLGNDGANEPNAWRSWEAEVETTPGRQHVMARATDGTGAVQPMKAEPNGGGFGNNSIHVVSFDVVRA
jgi:DMSO/TMAO reductase YedYZ molybdopterin-dependent catalytic subunit